MDIFEGPYFIVNQRLHVILGVWPYLPERKKKIISYGYMAFLKALAMPHLLSMIVNFDNIDRVMLNFISYFTVIIGMFKMGGLMAEEDRMKNLYESIANNWLAIQGEKEREILHKYSARGRLLSILHLVFASLTLVVILLPMVPKILDKLDPLPEPRPDMYVLEGEFFIDRKSHFALICFVDWVTMAATFAAAIAADSMYVTCSQHSCALYAIVSYRLRQLKQMALDDDSSTIGDCYDWLVETIRLHQTALSFTSTLNDAYSTAFLLMMPFCLFLVPFDSCAILANLDRPLYLIPYVAYFVSTAVHMLILCWPGQKILDHQLTLCDDACCNEWYTTPFHTKKLLLIFMTRCTQPAAISGGGLFLLSYETFSIVFRTAVSYITVAASFR